MLIGIMATLDQLIASYISEIKHDEQVSRQFKAVGTGNSNGINKQLATSLWLRLINETYITLPVINCSALIGQPQASGGPDQVESRCRVNWNEAKLFNGSIIDSRSRVDGQLVTISDLRVENFTTNFNNTDLQHNNLAIWTYLTFGSFFSMVGLLINLLIILIVFINAKQKICNNQNLIRGSSSCHHYILLTQLTLTGLILAAYSLIDNANLFQAITSNNQFDSKVCHRPATLAAHNELHVVNYINNNFTNPHDRHYCDHELSGHESSFRELLSPVSTFLPKGSPRVVSNLQSTRCDDAKYFQLLDKQRGNYEKLALKLIFHSPIRFSRAQANRNNKSRYWYLRLESSAGSQNDSSNEIDEDEHLDELFDLSTVLDSIELTLLSAQPSVVRNHGDPVIDYDYQEYSGSIMKQQEKSSDNIVDLDSSGMLINLVGSIHLWTVAILAYDRYNSIAHPLRNLKSFGALKTRALFVVVWALSILLNLIVPIVVWRAHEQMVDATQTLPMAAGQVDWLSLITVPGPTIDRGQTMINQQGTLAAKYISILLAELSAKLYGSGGKGRMQLSESEWLTSYTFQIIIIAISSISFLLFILVPLVMITICNIGIYQIVKTHERRLSTSSSSQGGYAASGYGGGGGGGQPGATPPACQASIPRHANQAWRDYEDRSDTNSIASSIISKLIWATSQIGILSSSLGAHQHTELAVAGNVCDESEFDQFEACHLIDGANETDPATAYHNAAPHRQKISDQHIDTHQHGANIVNRSNRRPHVSLSQRDSCEPLGELTAANHQHQQPFAAQHAGPIAITTTTTHNNISQHKRLKRKSSDQQEEQQKQTPKHLWRQGNCCHNYSTEANYFDQLSRRSSSSIMSATQKYSTTSKDDGCVGELTKLNSQDSGCDDCESIYATNFCCCNQQRSRSFSKASDNSTASKIDKQDSIRIIQQLRMAGLSFAGIALTNEEVIAASAGTPMGTKQRSGHNQLHRSSSCSYLTNSAPTTPKSTATTTTTTKQPRTIQRQQSTASNQSALGNHRTSPKINNHNNNNNNTNRHHNKQRQVLGFNAWSSDSLVVNGLKRTQNALLPSMVGRVVAGGHHADLVTAAGFHQSIISADDQSSMPRRFTEIESHYENNQYCSQLVNHTSRQSSFGTKSSIFNLIIWLIVTILLLALPKNLMNIFDQTAGLTNATRPMRACSHHMRLQNLNEQDLVQYERLLRVLFNKSTNENGSLLNIISPMPPPVSKGPTKEFILLWLDCINRLLFMMMVFLNAWLYGIRSRSLKVTLKMILRRYISKRQASIEIDQRRRSNTASLRSRESLFASLPQYFYPLSNNPSHHNPNRINATRRAQKTFMRSLSLNTPTSRPIYEDDAMLVDTTANGYQNSTRKYSTGQIGGRTYLISRTPSADSPERDVVRSPRHQNNNTIRFEVEDDQSDNHQKANDSDLIMSSKSIRASDGQQILSTKTTTRRSCNQAGGLPIAETVGSLISSSIKSSQFLLLDKERQQQQQATLNEMIDKLSRPIVPHGVLKKTGGPINHDSAHGGELRDYNDCVTTTNTRYSIVDLNDGAGKPFSNTDCSNELINRVKSREVLSNIGSSGDKDITSAVNKINKTKSEREINE